jgi:spore germination protein YaaH
MRPHRALLTLLTAMALAVGLPASAPAAPPPTAGTAHAFLLASTDKSYEDFRANYGKIGTVYPTYFQCDRTNGTIVGGDHPHITRYAQARKVQVLARFDCQHTATMHRILTDPALRERTLAGLMALVAAHGYDGINLDFEAGLASDRAAYTSFVADLAGRLHGAGKKLSVCVSAKFADAPSHPRSGLYDYPALANVADYVFVMAWGIHWQTSAPGPVADWPWFKRVVDYVATLPSHERYVIGTPLYGFDWTAGGGPSRPGKADEYQEVMRLAEQVGATPQFDPGARELHFRYTDQAGSPHEVWVPSAQAILERFNYARERGFGIGMWRLGREDQQLWASL